MEIKETIYIEASDILELIRKGQVFIESSETAGIYFLIKESEK